VDDIFKALADPTRRKLLDSLRDRAGQTLTELEQGLGMTRFGVMKHLKVLEEAKLVTSRKEGRFRYHYLNAAPIQEVADRWIAPYQKPFARYALNLKAMLESRATMPTKPDFILETFIKTTQDALWEALINPDQTELYYFGGRLKSSLKPGAPFQYLQADGTMLLDGELLEIHPKRRIVSTFIPNWGEERQASKVTFDLEPFGDVVKFTITHQDMDKAPSGVTTGWAQVASSLKSFLESGAPLSYPPANM
jgi:DNA-binding transcriptional ArsR family regulator/uncharacterized protein YndB with AHSA1/START domain